MSDSVRRDINQLWIGLGITAWLLGSGWHVSEMPKPLNLTGYDAFLVFFVYALLATPTAVAGAALTKLAVHAAKWVMRDV